MKVVCSFCGEEFSNLGIANHIAFVHTKSRQNLGNRTKGKIPWNKGLTKETDIRVKSGSEKSSKALKGKIGKKHSEETKSKISISKLGNKNATNRVDRQNFYKEIRMDSKWEVAVAKYLDDLSVEWKYNLNGFKLSDGRYYYPDFFIYNGGEFKKLIEVKGYFRESNRIKFDLFLTNYPDIVVELWDKIKLRELCIINISGYVMPKYSVDGSGSDCKSDG